LVVSWPSFPSSFNFLFGDVLLEVFFNLDVFGGDSAEDVDFERDMVLDESNSSVPDSDDSPFLDELGTVSLKEGVGRSSFVSDDGSDESGEAVVGLGFFGFDDFNVNVVAVSGIDQRVNLNKVRFGELGHKVEIKY
jgi:hypothetical protein